MKTALYYRVSTGDQNTDSQKTSVEGFAARAGWGDTQVYTDTISGKTANRPGLDLLLKHAREGKIERILCYKLDRIGRSVLHLSQLMAELKTLKIPVYVTSQGISTDQNNPAADLFFNMLMCFAEFERSLICERVKAGLAVRKASGKRLGRVPMDQATKDKIRALRASGKPISAIAQELGVAVGSVCKWIKPAPAS